MGQKTVFIAITLYTVNQFS